jgi:hypothetical protein
MLRFKSFLTEAKEGSKAGAAANTNGVRHELLTAGVLNHMSKHHNSSNNPYHGGNHPNLFEMDDKELKEHFDNHVKSGHFSEHHMPEHYRDQDNQTPKSVHDRYTHESLEPEEHYSHFRNAVHHAKELHKHLEERGYDPKSLSNVAWTSVDGNVNSYMKKHGDSPDRKMNKGTDDADVMATIKDKKGNQKPIGLSLKWGSQKNQTPTTKNNTHNTILDSKDFGNEHEDTVNEFKAKAKIEVDNHKKLTQGIYSGGQSVRKHKYDHDVDSLRASPDDERLKNNVKTVNDSYESKNQNVASHLENTLNKIKDAPNGHEHIKNFVRNKLQIPNPDFVAARAHMTVDKNNNVNGHHFEDHSTSLNDHLNNANHFKAERSGATLRIHAMDKSGTPLFSHKMWVKGNSRKSDDVTKILHATEKPSSKKGKTVNKKQNTTESVIQMLDKVIDNNLVESTDSFKAVLSSKIASRLLEAKKAVYSERYDKDLDKNKNGKLDSDDFKKLRVKKYTNKCDTACNEEAIEDALNEVLNPSMGVKAYIDDFIKSDDSRFEGDSKEKRRQRAIAAFYSNKN